MPKFVISSPRDFDRTFDPENFTVIDEEENSFGKYFHIRCDCCKRKFVIKQTEVLKLPEHPCIQIPKSEHFTRITDENGPRRAGSRYSPPS